MHKLACIFDGDMTLNYRVAAFTQICMLRKSLSTVLDLERFAMSRAAKWIQVLSVFSGFDGFVRHFAKHVGE